MDLEIRSLSDYNNYQAMIDIWNHTMDEMHQVSYNLFMQNSILDDNIVRKSSYVAIHKGTLVGYIILKTNKDSLLINNSQMEAFINVILVDKSFQKQGIGSKLLAMVESYSRVIGISTLTLGCSTKTYGPGVFGSDSEKIIRWFKTRGYRHTYEAFDLHMKGINGNLIKLENHQDVYFRKGILEDKEKLITFLKSEFHDGWAHEAIVYFKQGGDGSEYVLLFNSKDEIIGFCKLNDLNSITLGHSVSWHVYYHKIGGIGPLGVGQAYRKKNLGFYITGAAINELITQGCENIIVNWTGIVDFYKKFGFQISDRYYGFQKKLF
ncbi:GNAT family N-acetyltransferase [Mycoplasmatota bacterium]|nr:GNAT family N-acetyltransferase [Mycoplasmatota bacterium]